jgi:UDP-N-acetylmuramate--alanine ligase
MSTNVRTWERIHFVGIGGIGMSGLARIAAQRGSRVSGSDMHRSDVAADLEALGISVAVGHCAQNLPIDVDLVVRSAAVPDTNPEVAFAVASGIPVLRYSRFLGMCMQGYRGLAVAGTHGKTSTTAMISHALCETGLDPTFLVGGLLPGGRGNASSGSSPHFVTEACEFAESFLDLSPHTAVLTNLEEDHLDYYGTFRNLKKAFEDFVGRLPEDGLLLVNADDFEAMGVAVRAANCRLLTFALEAGAALKARRLRERRGRYTFDIEIQGRMAGRIRLNVPGRHNVYNALAAAGACLEAGAEPKPLFRALSNFEGVLRRFEVVGRVSDTTVVSDYAHHPTEIRAALDCARKTMPHRRIVCVFQPHQGSRTRLLMKEFASAFIQADMVILPEIYYVRDADDESVRVSSRDLAKEISAFGTRAVFLPDFSDVLAHLKANVNRGDVIMAMGAGNIDDLPGRVLSMLRTKFGSRRFAQPKRRRLPRTFEEIRKKLVRRAVEPRMAYAT